MGRACVSAPLDSIDLAARPIVVAYLDELAAGLPCSRSARAAILDEVGDGLVEAVTASSEAGLSPAVAARTAVAQFGAPPVLAAGFAAELAGVAAHRVGLALIGTGPIVGAVWLAAFSARSGLTWWHQLMTLWSTVPAYALILALAVPAALVAAAAGSGRLPDWAGLGSKGAAGAAMIAATGCVIGDASLLTGLAASAGSGWSALAWGAAGLSLVRLSSVAAAGRRCARLRSAAA